MNHVRALDLYAVLPFYQMRNPVGNPMGLYIYMMVDDLLLGGQNVSDK